MAINPANAASAYMKVASQGIESATNTATESGRGEFTELFKDVLADVSQTMQRSEEISLKAVFGEAQMTDVIAAVTAAEVTLQTVVEVRDKLVQAYQQILRMPM
ncbi:MAG: flagellar hook-basal body complex protein FliE [Qipengyuania citrea]